MTRPLHLLSTLIFLICLFPLHAKATEAPNLGPLLKKAIDSPGKSFRLDSGNAKAVDEKARLRINQNLGRLPLRFEKNEGQTAEEVKFFSRGQGYQFFLTPTESVMVLTQAERKHPRERFDIQRAKFEEPEKVEHAVVRMQVVGGNPDPVIRGEDKLPGTSNYFVGNDKSRWRQGVENFARVHYEEVYPGIDLVYYGNRSKLEYDFIVKPGADPKKIELNFSGADGISIDGQGNLVLKTTVGDIVQHAPVIYQTIAGKKKPIAGRYVLADNHYVTFHVSEYDPEHELVIDPVLEYSTYLGRNGITEICFDMAVDDSNNVYLTGFTESSDFPSQNSLPGASNTGGIFIVKIHDDNGVPSIVYSILLGKLEFYSRGMGIDVDSQGNVYVAGITGDINFPLLNEIMEDPNGAGAFILKIREESGMPDLVFSTFLGGSGADFAFDMVLGPAGSIFVAGTTTSTDFPM